MVLGVGSCDAQIRNRFTPSTLQTPILLYFQCKVARQRPLYGQQFANRNVCKVPTIILSSMHIKSLELWLLCCYATVVVMAIAPWKKDRRRSEILPSKFQENGITCPVSDAHNCWTFNARLLSNSRYYGNRMTANMSGTWWDARLRALKFSRNRSTLYTQKSGVAEYATQCCMTYNTQCRLLTHHDSWALV